MENTQRGELIPVYFNKRRVCRHLHETFQPLRQDQGWEQSEPQGTCRGLPLGQLVCPASTALLQHKSSCKDVARLPAPSRSREHCSSFPCMPWSARSKPVSLTGIGHWAQAQQYPLNEDEVRMQRLHQRLVEAAAIPLTSTELPQSTNTESWRVLTTEDYGLLPPYWYVCCCFVFNPLTEKHLV